MRMLMRSMIGICGEPIQNHYLANIYYGDGHTQLLPPPPPPPLMKQSSSTLNSGGLVVG